MSKNNSVVPQARAALDQFKMEAAREVGVQSLVKESVQHTV
ncbi:MAG: small, acid-soluble spore protein, alpha/beta type [Clostridia bacterium]|nr:small, acid-soluble spore protein, alpha/beta type [Clostridia bacterium]